MGSFSIWHWLIVLLVVVLIFGTKKLRNIGSDVGGAVKNFKEAMNEEKGNADAPVLNTVNSDSTSNLIEAKAVEVPAVKAAPRKKAATAKPAAVKPATVKPATKKPATPKAAAKPKTAATSKTK